MGSDSTDLQRRLDAGERLSPGEAAELLGIHRSTVDRMLKSGALAYYVKPGSGEHREVDPESLRAELARRAERHGGEDQPSA